MLVHKTSTAHHQKPCNQQTHPAKASHPSMINTSWINTYRMKEPRPLCCTYSHSSSLYRLLLFVSFHYSGIYVRENKDNKWCLFFLFELEWHRSGTEWNGTERNGKPWNQRSGNQKPTSKRKVWNHCYWYKLALVLLLHRMVLLRIETLFGCYGLGNEFRWDNYKSSFSTALRNRMRNLLVFHFLCIRLGELMSLTIVWLEEGFIVFLVFVGRISVSLMFTTWKGLCSSWFWVSVVSDWSMRT